MIDGPASGYPSDYRNAVFSGKIKIYLFPCVLIVTDYHCVIVLPKNKKTHIFFSG